MNAVVPYENLEKETISWCNQILEKSPTAIRLLKASLNADCDGQSGLQQLAGDATMMFYMSDEAKEGRDDLSGKPDQIKAKIVEGRIGKRLKEMALLEQPFIKDSSINVEELVKQVAGKIGENVKVRRFTRYTLGEGIEVQEKGTNPLVRSMGESRGIGQTGVRSSLGHSGIGLGFGEPTTVFPPRTNWFGPNACRPSTRTTVDLRLPLIGSSQGRLNLSLTGFPKLEGERGLSLHRSECKVVRPLVPPMSPVRRDVLTN